VVGGEAVVCNEAPGGSAVVGGEAVVCNEAPGGRSRTGSRSTTLRSTRSEA
jgi:serine acetyltransferase